MSRLHPDVADLGEFLPAARKIFDALTAEGFEDKRLRELFEQRMVVKFVGLAPDRVVELFALVSKGRVDQATGTVLGLGAKLGPLATQLVELALAQEGLILFRDERREPYASLRMDRGRRTVALGSREFGAWIRELAWRELGRPLSAESSATVRQTLAALATEDHRLHVRHAMHEGEIWIDLDGYRAIRVRPGGWRSSPNRRSCPELSTSATTTDPVPGGDPWEIERFVNLKSADDCSCSSRFSSPRWCPTSRPPPSSFTGSRDRRKPHSSSW